MQDDAMKNYCQASKSFISKKTAGYKPAVDSACCYEN